MEISLDITPNNQKEAEKQNKTPLKKNNFEAGGKYFDQDFLAVLEKDDPFKGSKDFQRIIQMNKESARNEDLQQEAIQVHQSHDQKWIPKEQVQIEITKLDSETRISPLETRDSNRGAFGSQKNSIIKPLPVSEYSDIGVQV